MPSAVLGRMMTRCCLCRAPKHLLEVPPAQTRESAGDSLEPTTLPGGYRCTDHTACRERVRDIVAANVGLGEVCGQ